MPGFNPLFPRRILVDEIITTGVAQRTGVTGWTAQGATLRYNSWVAPLPPSSSMRVMLPVVATSSAAQTITQSSQLVGNPDYPRAVRVASTTSQACTQNIIVTGIDQFGATVTDTIPMGIGSAAVDGTLAFKIISSIVIPASTSMSTSIAVTGPVITIGLSNIFGLDRLAASTGAAVKGVVNGTAETTLPIIGAPSTSFSGGGGGLGSITRATAKFATAATSSTGALVEIIYAAQDTTHI